MERDWLTAPLTPLSDEPVRLVSIKASSLFPFVFGEAAGAPPSPIGWTDS